MTFQGLIYFLAVYEEGSITTAAQRLYITQQTLSAHIQRLEESCGTALFIRRPALQPTYAGDRLAIYARDILRLQKELLSEMREIGEEVLGRMSLGFSAFLTAPHLPHLLGKFYALHPQVEVITVPETSAQLEERTLSGELDLYIGTAKSGEMTALPLGEISLMVLVRASVLRRYGVLDGDALDRALRNGVSLAELKALPFILPRRGWRVREPIDHYIRQHKLNLRIMLEATEQITASAVAQGLGAGIVYSVTALPPLAEDDILYRFPLQDIQYTVQSCICYRPDHYLTRYEQDFIGLVQGYFSTLL